MPGDLGVRISRPSVCEPHSLRNGLDFVGRMQNAVVSLRKRRGGSTLGGVRFVGRRGRAHKVGLSGRPLHNLDLIHVDIDDGSTDGSHRAGMD